MLICTLHAKGTYLDTAGLLTHEGATFCCADKSLLGCPMAFFVLFSNTVVAAVPDSNRIPY